MPSEEFATYREILSQPDAWADALVLAGRAPLLEIGSYDQVIFTGCGSTYYLSLTAAAFCQELTGQISHAVPAGELLFYPQMTFKRPQMPPNKTLLVAISRSGTTTETLRAVESFKQGRGGDVIVITNNHTSLSQYADVNLVITTGQEESVAQTRSFASMLVGVTALFARLAGRDDLFSSMDSLPDIGKRLMDRYLPLAQQVGADLAFDRFYFLGSGMRYGMACEANLKMKEMSLTHSEPFHFLEFRHGPMSMVTRNTVVVGLLSEQNYAAEAKVLSEMGALGGSVVSLAEQLANVEFQSGLPEPARAVLYLPILQLMAFFRSTAKGYNPDRPKNLSAVVFLDL
jgi:glutamine---fructose-6-phosphate transaminase (isomerizing)